METGHITHNEKINAPDLPPELHAIDAPESDHVSVLARIPEPWRARVTGRRYRRWRHASRHIRRYNAALPADARTLNFFPMRPQPHVPITEMVRILGLRIGFTPGGPGGTIAWDGDTWFSRWSARRLPTNAINGRCLDISKSRVHAVWEQASGRTVAVDPLTYVGPIVEKPEENGRHGGRVIIGPLQHRRRGWVYERLVETRVGGYVTESRPVFIDGRMVLAYEKFRPTRNLFFGTALSLVRQPNEIYSHEEQELLTRFASMMDLEYGELDVIRDTADGVIYAVDVNRTPSRAINLPSRFEPEVWRLQAEAFDALLKARF